ncbi:MULTISPECIES: glutamate-1-semialdehyde 2,1-aminomutase [unclassified Mucilaginibacter]|uniref:glutamate-1-semialdehyde 2,1-aminomutase n=1 Tax=unclassified Mucilaginibacter TaxID=2617802 RepID=UPI002AC92D64|nr:MULTISPECIES: glutamate-1-semialdehyde 2,1-aminomutase [unclassified Mucilaginibacter]MEB0262843.1 glutamate-1-semialdehyde 2,1-aminomutase [Mucilaginibacter sp. 10I4]MEB0277682.1 glutamate-1-semialdehyde 2,1-aminomutase [Mucilaginibacter sp. 10B2]MEB0301941.1 glutamate-1-semialdehyde 2,1-aminomutase [Mucilaginibacter sp. 5C4]WPX24691.1 glutamate-1-semialdehyde 2,1-aminomutase [Mucilaginibacter sp. 5C4]
MSIPDISRAKSAALYEKAKTYFPGGVNSPVRAFKSVYGTPLFIEKGDGSHIWDADGNEFIDFCCSWGPLILGHNSPAVREKVIEVMQNGMSFGAPTALENELAELILSKNKFIQKIRFVSSGTEAVMSAIRLARGYTKRDKILKFEGCYHGHTDALLVKAGSGLVTFGETSSAGVPKAFADETIVVSLNDKKALEEAFEEFKGQIAAVIIEPVPANNGLLLQNQDYLDYLRQVCTDNGTMLIFDEVISGFRVGFEGAAGYYNIQPDIITYGKIIGGGLPVGAYGASAEVMDHISPVGSVYQAGTLSGNPVAMAAGIAQLTELLKPGFYDELHAKTAGFVKDLQAFIDERGYMVKIFTIGSIFWFAFTDLESITTAEQIDPASMIKFKEMHRELINRGIYLGPSGYEVGFISAAHTQADLETTKTAIFDSLDIVFSRTQPSPKDRA